MEAIGQRVGWTPEKVILALKALAAADIPASSTLRRDKSARTLAVLREALGHEATGSGLYQAGFRYFGSWDAALVAAGLDPKDDFAWSRDRIIAAIRAMKAADIPLHSNAIQKDRSELTADVLARAIGRKKFGSNVYQAVKLHFGSWDKALEAAGIDPASVRKRVDWSEAMIVKAIQALHREGVALNSGAIQADESPRTRAIIERELGVSASGLTLHAAAASLLTWDGALRKAGLDPADVRSRASWNEKMIVDSLRALHEAGVPLNVAAMMGDDSARTRLILRRVTGQEVTGARLVAAVDRLIGTWDAGLRKAGLDPAKIRLTVPWDPELVVKCIKALHEEGLPLNAATLHFDRSPEVTRKLKELTGRDITGSKLRWAGLRYFASWDEALRKAGLNPWDIRRRLWARSRLSMIPHQVENVETPEGRSRARFIGRAAARPESEVDSRAFSEALEGAMGELPERERAIVAQMLDFVMASDKALEARDLAVLLSDESGSEVAESDVKRWLAFLAGNREIQSFR